VESEKTVEEFGRVPYSIDFLGEVFFVYRYSEVWISFFPYSRVFPVVCGKSFIDYRE
jgi:hypothetical protein